MLLSNPKHSTPVIPGFPNHLGPQIPSEGGKGLAPSCQPANEGIPMQPATYHRV